MRKENSPEEEGNDVVIGMDMDMELEEGGG